VAICLDKDDLGVYSSATLPFLHNVQDLYQVRWAAIRCYLFACCVLGVYLSATLPLLHNVQDLYQVRAILWAGCSSAGFGVQLPAAWSCLAAARAEHLSRQRQVKPGTAHSK